MRWDNLTRQQRIMNLPRTYPKLLEILLSRKKVNHEMGQSDKAAKNK
jgi:hypothetical protein